MGAVIFDRSISFAVAPIMVGLFLCAALGDEPASSSTAEISVCFAPEQDCAAFATAAIDKAQREILVGSYNLTTGAGIVEALIRAKQRGVAVQLITDKTTPCERDSGVAPLMAAAVPIWIDYRVRIAHAKTMVVDGIATLAGSFNWTRAASMNSEDLNLISSPAVAALYATHWQQRLAASVVFIRQEDWCSMKVRR